MLYPQQNLSRNILDLSGIWDFKIDPEQMGEDQNWCHGLGNSRPIAVPGSWNEQYSDLYDYLGLAWYAKSMFVPPSWRGQRIFLRVGSACYLSQVYVNGQSIGCHEGGHLPFAFEITNAIRWDADNIVVISVENELKPERVPSGNMSSPLLSVSSYPRTTYDFYPFAGIHRPVLLCSVPQIFIEDVAVVTAIDDANGRVTISILLNKKINDRGSISLHGKGYSESYKLEFNDGKATAELTVPNANFWSPDSPFLYDLTIQFQDDEYRLPVGIRTVAVENGKILLNGKPVQLNGFGRHEDFFASGKGLNLPLLIKDYQLMCWTGANSYRTSHYPYSEEEMQLADREGFLIINEIPAVSLQFEDDKNIALRQQMCLQQIDELIARDKNHPCVLMWCVANEPMTAKLGDLAENDPSAAKGKAFLDSLINRVRKLDPTRLVTIAALGGTPADWLEQCDVISLNRYWGWYALGGELDKAIYGFEQELEVMWQTYHKPILISEFGADTMAGMHGHPDLMWTEEYQADLIRRHLEVASRKDFITGMHVWNFADFAAIQSILRVGGLNMKGVFTRMRTPKMAAHVLRSFWQKNK